MKIFFLYLTLSIVHVALYAQNNTRTAPPDSSKLLYFQKVKEMKLIKDPNYYYKHKVNLAKYNELKMLGVDLKELDKKAGRLNYKEYSLMSETIVEGVILSKVYDNRKDVHYHTTYKILVKEVIKGEVSKDTVELKTVSGMHGENYISSSNEPEFYLGERVILFMDPISIEEFNEARKKGTFNKILNCDASSYSLRLKTIDKTGYLYVENGKLGKTSEIKIEIQNIIETNK